MYKKVNKIHFVGIGGIGMSSLAHLLIKAQYQVTGSDLSFNENIKNLELLGVKCFIDHREENIQNAELLVYSSAILNNNPELIAARKKNIPTIPRAEMLAEMMRLKYGIAVAGAHGKTTTTSMIAQVLEHAGLDPTAVVGGKMHNFNGLNAKVGNGEFMVVEADESDGSFNRLSPSIAIVTNIDKEHLDYYKTMENLSAAFYTFVEKVPFYGLSVLCGDDVFIKEFIHKISRRKMTYGIEKQNDYRILSYKPNTAGSVSVIETPTSVETIQLKIPGIHNVLNACAALVVSDELCIARSTTIEGLSNFDGVARRFQIKGEIKGVTFIDDYAHHPTEIERTLKAASEKYPHSKIHVLFQPHRYTRTLELESEFLEAFHSCHELAIVPIYSAGEKPIDGVDSKMLSQKISKKGDFNCEYVENPLEHIHFWLKNTNPNDIILTLGAGDLPKLYKELF